MSLEEEKEFWDMTPHRLQVTSYSSRNNYGRKELDPTSVRTYRCLMQVTASIEHGVQNSDQTVGIVAWCLGTPITGEDSNGEDVNSETPISIQAEDSAKFLSPDMPVRPIKSVEAFYDETGYLHNMIVRFS